MQFGFAHDSYGTMSFWDAPRIIDITGSAERPKRKRVSLTLQQKLELCQRLDQGVSRQVLMKEYNVGSSTIYDIRCQRPKLLKFLMESQSYDEIERRKNVVFTRPRIYGPTLALCKKVEQPESIEVPPRVRSPSNKRTIKKPKMDQFVTFSDSSGLEDQADNSSNYELSNESADDTGANISASSYATPQICLKEPYQRMKYEDGESKDPWSASTIPDEVTIEEVKPMLEVYLDTNLEDGENPLEESPQNPFVGSTSEAENMANTVTMHAMTENAEEGHLVYEVDNVYLDNGKSSEQKDGMATEGSLLPDYTLMWIEKKMKSPVWKHFKRFSSDNATCNYCSAILKTPKGSTSSMARHLLTHFKDKKGERSFIENLDEYDDLQKSLPIQLSSKRAVLEERRTKDMMEKDKKGERNSMENYDELGDLRKSFQIRLPSKRSSLEERRAEEVTEKVAYMLAKDCLPISVVAGEGFRSLVKELEPSYELPPSHKFMDVVIPELYEKALRKVTGRFTSSVKDATSFSLSADTWNSDKGIGYISLTCHRMTEDFEIERHFIGVSHFPGKKTGAELHKKLLSMLEGLGMKEIDAKVYVVTDKAREMQAALQKGSWMVVPCFARNLQLAVNDAKAAMPDFAELRRKCRDITTRYKCRGAARDRLVAARKEGGAKEDESAITGKWDEDFNMFQRLSEQAKEIKEDLEKEVGIEDLSEGDWESVKVITEILTPIDQAMKDFCVDGYPPLSMTIPIIYGIEHMLNDQLDKGAVFAKNLLKAMKARFPSYRTNKTPLLAMILDPRYKAVILTEQEVNLVTKMVTDEISEGLNSQTKETTSSEEVEEVDDKGEEGSKKRCSLWSAFEKITKEQPAPSEKKIATYQVKQYLDQPVMPRSSDPYKWWKENREKYNLLIPLAIRYLSIPATQIKSSVLLSTENSMLAGRREKLEVSNAEQLVFLHENLCAINKK